MNASCSKEETEHLGKIRNLNLLVQEAEKTIMTMKSSLEKYCNAQCSLSQFTSPTEQESGKQDILCSDKIFAIEANFEDKLREEVEAVNSLNHSLLSPYKGNKSTHDLIDLSSNSHLNTISELQELDRPEEAATLNSSAENLTTTTTTTNTTTKTAENLIEVAGVNNDKYKSAANFQMDYITPITNNNENTSGNILSSADPKNYVNISNLDIQSLAEETNRLTLQILPVFKIEKELVAETVLQIDIKTRRKQEISPKNEIQSGETRQQLDKNNVILNEHSNTDSISEAKSSDKFKDANQSNNILETKSNVVEKNNLTIHHMPVLDIRRELVTQKVLQLDIQSSKPHSKNNVYQEEVYFPTDKKSSSKRMRCKCSKLHNYKTCPSVCINCSACHKENEKRDSLLEILIPKPLEAHEDSRMQLSSAFHPQEKSSQLISAHEELKKKNSLLKTLIPKLSEINKDSRQQSNSCSNPQITYSQEISRHEESNSLLETLISEPSEVHEDSSMQSNSLSDPQVKSSQVISSHEEKNSLLETLIPKTSEVHEDTRMQSNSQSGPQLKSSQVISSDEGSNKSNSLLDTLIPKPSEVHEDSRIQLNALSHQQVKSSQVISSHKESNKSNSLFETLIPKPSEVHENSRMQSNSLSDQQVKSSQVISSHKESNSLLETLIPKVSEVHEDSRMQSNSLSDPQEKSSPEISTHEENNKHSLETLISKPIDVHEYSRMQSNSGSGPKEKYKKSYPTKRKCCKCSKLKKLHNYKTYICPIVSINPSTTHEQKNKNGSLLETLIPKPLEVNENSRLNSGSNVQEKSSQEISTHEENEKKSFFDYLLPRQLEVREDQRKQSVAGSHPENNSSQVISSSTIGTQKSSNNYTRHEINETNTDCNKLSHKESQTESEEVYKLNELKKIHEDNIENPVTNLSLSLEKKVEVLYNEFDFKTNSNSISMESLSRISKDMNSTEYSTDDIRKLKSNEMTDNQHQLDRIVTRSYDSKQSTVLGNKDKSKLKVNTETLGSRTSGDNSQLRADSRILSNKSSDFRSDVTNRSKKFQKDLSKLGSLKEYSDVQSTKTSNDNIEQPNKDRGKKYEASNNSESGKTEYVLVNDKSMQVFSDNMVSDEYKHVKQYTGSKVETILDHSKKIDRIKQKSNRFFSVPAHQSQNRNVKKEEVFTLADDDLCQFFQSQLQVPCESTTFPHIMDNDRNVCQDHNQQHAGAYNIDCDKNVSQDNPSYNYHVEMCNNCDNYINFYSSECLYFNDNKNQNKVPRPINNICRRDPYKKIHDISEGEVSCQCCISDGELHQCLNNKTTSIESGYSVEIPQKEEQFSVTREHYHNRNFVSYYISKNPHAKSDNS